MPMNKILHAMDIQNMRVYLQTIILPEEAQTTQKEEMNNWQEHTNMSFT